MMNKGTINKGDTTRLFDRAVQYKDGLRDVASHALKDIPVEQEGRDNAVDLLAVGIHMGCDMMHLNDFKTKVISGGLGIIAGAVVTYGVVKIKDKFKKEVVEEEVGE